MCGQCTYVKTGNVILKTSNEKSKQQPGFESCADYRVSHIEMGKVNAIEKSNKYTNCYSAI